MKKVISIILSAMLAVTLMMPVMSDVSYGAVDVRTSMPSFSSTEGKQYYYTENNLFYKYNLAPNRRYLSKYGGYCTGNCTWYAYARASEKNGKWINSNFRWSASRWWDLNRSNHYYPYGSTPKVGAIACYSTHVAVVEKVVNGQPYVSESGWRVSRWRPYSASQLCFHYGRPWEGRAKGYIYVGDSSANKVKNVNYNVKISVKDLNMRMGPGTGYRSAGHVKKGTYHICQESGGWGKLSDNGYWIYLKYAPKVSAPSKPTVDKGSKVSYNVKVSVTNLNMRTGPSTSYAKKGYIKPGTYKVTRSYNGWVKLSKNGYWIASKYAPKTSGTVNNGNSGASSIYKVKVTAIALNMRSGPGEGYSRKGLLFKGSTQDITETKKGWGQLKKNGYWIKLSYTTPVNRLFNVKVTYDDLNMRTGPSIFSKKKGHIKPGTYTIDKTDGGWGRLKYNGYWIKLSYAKKI